MKGRIPQPADPTFLTSIQQPLYLRIDFGNGSHFSSSLDAQTTPANVRLGARILAGFLHVNPETVVQWFPSMESLEPSMVIQEIVRHTLLNRPSDSVLCIIIHIDEYQQYIDSCRGTFLDPHEHWKQILRGIGQLMR
ncbi:MAG: hypothetical protein KJ043_19970, partial [Anaerolineae bacterium]|nr:hypothetical protein [Anaerolineae bacterium]